MLAGVGESFAATVVDGPLVLGMAVAALAGLVSFLSPCVLPLVPGYLGYLTGLSGTDATAGGVGAVGVKRAVTGRAVAATVLFVLGFTAVFVSYGAAFGNIGAKLLAYQSVIQRVMGVVLILLGLGFLGLIRPMQRELRIRWLPRAGLAGAPLLGVLFGVGWTPCVGPTLGAVQTLASARGVPDVVRFCPSSTASGSAYPSSSSPPGSASASTNSGGCDEAPHTSCAPAVR